MKKVIFALPLLLLLGFIAIAESPKPSILVQAIAPSAPLVSGEIATVTVKLTVPNSYHINSDRPLQDYLIPTTLEFEPDPNVRVSRVVFPTAVIKRFQFSDTPLAVFEGVVGIKAEIDTLPGLSSGEITLRGRVRYQACDNQTCFPPAVQSFSLTIPIRGTEDSSFSASPTGSRQGEREASAAGSAIAQFSFPGFLGFEDRGLPVMLMLVFLGGLALNLTPCVYPMIPITITYFGSQAQGKKGSIFFHSLLYVFGMAVTYSTLGVAAAMTGGLVGGAHQYPAVLIGIALVMVLLALSMFDVYELRLPGALARLAGGSPKGFLGTFLMGLTVGVIAAPCVGPFVLGLVTYVGSRGNVILGFSLFFILAMGLGLPFLLLGIFSGSLHKLPKSGAWMVWVRKIFGFVMLGMAVFFLKTLFPDLLVYHLAIALVMLLAGIYLAWIDPVPYSGKLFPVVRNVVGSAFFIVALYASVMGVQAGIMESHRRSAGTNLQGAIQWASYSEEMLRMALQEGKPIIIDFFADWCAPCKELDERTFSKPEIVRLSREFIMLKVDLTDAEDREAEALRRKYEVRGVPTLIFLKSDGAEIADLRSAGFVSPEIFVNKMRQALQRNAGSLQPPKGRA